MMWIVESFTYLCTVLDQKSRFNENTVEVTKTALKTLYNENTARHADISPTAYTVLHCIY